MKPARTTRVAIGAVCALALACAVSSAQDSTTPATTTHKTTASTKHSKKKKTAKVRGQQKIDSERATEIQQALIREHYLNGTATGTWNEASEDAMRRYQGDNGWQTKEVPDSRALIKLGLGPSHDHLLNPDSAMTSSAAATPPRPTSQTTAPTSTQDKPVTAPGATPVQSDPPSPQ